MIIIIITTILGTVSTCSSVDSNDRESRPPSKLLLPPIPDRNSSINNPKLGSSSEREADVWQGITGGNNYRYFF